MSETTRPEPLSLEKHEAIIDELLEMRVRIYRLEQTVSVGGLPEDFGRTWLRLWNGITDTIRAMHARFARDCPERCRTSPYYYEKPPG